MPYENYIRLFDGGPGLLHHNRMLKTGFEGIGLPGGRLRRRRAGSGTRLRRRADAVIDRGRQQPDPHAVLRCLVPRGRRVPLQRPGQVRQEL